MAAPDVDLIEMGDAAVARGHGDVLQLDVHVVFGFQQLAAVDLAGGQLEGDYVALVI